MATAFMGLEAVPSGRFNPMTGAWELFDELPESKAVRPANMVEAVEAMRGQPGKITPEMGKAMLENAARARTQTMLNPNLAANAMAARPSPAQAPAQAPASQPRSGAFERVGPLSATTTAGKIGAGLLEGIVPSAMVSASMDALRRPTEDYYRRFGLDPSEAARNSYKDLAVRAGGVVSDVGAGILDLGTGVVNVARDFGGAEPIKTFGEILREGDRPSRTMPRATAGGATTAPPGRQAVQGVPPPAYLMRQPEMPVAERVVPQGALGPSVAAPQRMASIGAPTAPTGAAPAEAAAAVVPAQTVAPQPAEMPQSTIDDAIKQYRSEIGRIDQAFEEYKNQTGMVAPKELTPADKWSILARGLGVAALVAAFPGAGLLMGLGAGGLAGSSAFDQARRQKELDAQAARDQLGKQFDQRRQIEKDRMGALGELLTTAVKRDEGMQDRNAAQSRLEQELAARREAAAMEAALRREGFQNAARIAGISAAARQQPGERGASRGVTYNIPEAIRNRAEFILLNTPGMTAPEAISMARMQVQSDIPLSLGGGADPDLERYGQ